MIGPSYLAAAREAYALLPGMADGMPDRVILRWARGAGFGVARWRRPGQWGDRARERRTRRLERASERQRWQRLNRDIARVHPNRATCRRWRREDLERCALEWGLTPKPGEPTKALAYRLRVHQTAPRGLTRADLEAMTGGVVSLDAEAGRILVTLPAGTSPEALADIIGRVDGHTPAHVLVDVAIAEVTP